MDRRTGGQVEERSEKRTVRGRGTCQLIETGVQ